MRRIQTLAAMTAAAVTATLVAAAPTTYAVPGTELVFDDLADIVLDEPNGRLFITGGPGTNVVEVFNLAGARLPAIADMPGASQMAMSDDGQSILVALADGDAIASINRTTLAVTKVDTGEGSCPYDVAESAGELWVSYGCVAPFTYTYPVGVLRLDPEAGNSIEHVRDIDGHHPPFLTAAPQAPGVLAVVEYDINYNYDGDVYDATGGPTPSLVARGLTTCGSCEVTFPAQANLVRLGGRLVNLTNNSTVATYGHGDAYAAAESPSGFLGLGGESDLWAYELSYGTKSVAHINTGRWWSYAKVARGGLEFSATRMHVVMCDYIASCRLVTHTFKRDSSVEVTIEKEKHYLYGKRYGVTVKLQTRGPNRTVRLYMKRKARETYLGSVTVPASGIATTTFIPRYDGYVVARFAGGPLDFPAGDTSGFMYVHDRVSATFRGHYARQDGAYLYRQGADPIITGRVLPRRTAKNLVYVNIDIKWTGVWQQALSVSVPMRSDSTYGIRFIGRKPRGLYRISISVPHNRHTSGGGTPWMYFRVT